MTTVDEQSSTPVIELVDVSKVYATGEIEVAALRNVSLRIDETEFVAIVGPSGSGQVDPDAHPRLSRRPDVGSIPASPATTCSPSTRTASRDVRNLFIGFVFQQFNLLAYMTGLAQRRTATDVRRCQLRGATRARAARARASRTCRPSRPPARVRCPGVSSSGLPSPARW